MVDLKLLDELQRTTLLLSKLEVILIPGITCWWKEGLAWDKQCNLSCEATLDTVLPKELVGRLPP